MSEPQTAHIVNDILTSFRSLVFELQNDAISQAKATAHLARMKLWAGSLGAHRHTGSRSLEYRLRDASSIRGHVISLLQELRDAVEQAIAVVKGEAASPQETPAHSHIDDELAELLGDSVASSASELDLQFGDISHVLDCLLRLSVTIRNPAPHDQFASRAGAALMNHFEEYDVRHVWEKFPDIDGPTAERLGKANTSRRQFFRYREEHHSKLAEGLGVEVATGEGERSTKASSLPDHLKDTTKGENSTPAQPLLADGDDRSEISKTSYAPSSNNPERLRVPPIPKEYIDGPFMCPYCWQMIEVDSRRLWKKHVFRDLRPYVCLEVDCLLQNNQFQRRTDWARHMRNVHWREWQCPFDCAEAFGSIEKFRHHVADHHQQNISSENQGVLEDMSSQPCLRKAAGPCPLCVKVELRTADQYYSHVSNHLAQLSLFALPPSDDADDEDSGFGDDGGVFDTHDPDPVIFDAFHGVQTVKSGYSFTSQRSEDDSQRRLSPGQQFRRTHTNLQSNPEHDGGTSDDQHNVPQLPIQEPYLGYDSSDFVMLTDREEEHDDEELMVRMDHGRAQSNRAPSERGEGGEPWISDRRRHFPIDNRNNESKKTVTATIREGETSVRSRWVSPKALSQLGYKWVEKGDTTTILSELFHTELLNLIKLSQKLAQEVKDTREEVWIDEINTDAINTRIIRRHSKKAENMIHRPIDTSTTQTSLENRGAASSDPLEHNFDHMSEQNEAKSGVAKYTERLPFFDDRHQRKQVEPQGRAMTSAMREHLERGRRATDDAGDLGDSDDGNDERSQEELQEEYQLRHQRERLKRANLAEDLRQKGSAERQKQIETEPSVERFRRRIRQVTNDPGKPSIPNDGGEEQRRREEDEADGQRLIEFVHRQNEEEEADRQRLTEHINRANREIGSREKAARGLTIIEDSKSAIRREPHAVRLPSPPPPSRSGSPANGSGEAGPSGESKDEKRQKDEEDAQKRRLMERMTPRRGLALGKRGGKTGAPQNQISSA